MSDYYERSRKKSLIGCLYSLTGIILLGILCLLCMLCSCTTIRYVPVETVRTEKVTVHDSVYLEKIVHDSVASEAKGDTMIIHHYHTEYKDRWRDRWKDSIRVDSVQVPFPVPAQLSKWQTFCCDYGKVMFGATICLIIILFIILLYWIQNRRNRKE